MTTPLQAFIAAPPDPDRRVAIDAVERAARRHPQALAFLGLWRDRKQAGTPLGRADFPSRALLGFMPHLTILEPIEGGQTWKLRLVGTAICLRFGADPTGWTIDQLYPGERAVEQARHYRRVAETAGYRVTEGRVAGAARDHLAVEFVNIAIEPPTPGLHWVASGVFVSEES